MKAIIVNHERGGSYVMDHAGCFRFVKGYASQPVGAEIELARQIPVQFGRIAAIAACLVVALMLSVFGILWNTESYSVYVDINPSIELVFNNLNRLKEARALNEDGAALLKDIKLRGSPADVIVDLIREAEARGYIVPGSDVLSVSIMITTRGGKAPEDYQVIINESLLENSMQSFVEVDICDEDFRDRAEEFGVSPGKLRLAERLYASDQSTDISVILKLSVKDLMEEIRIAEEKGVPSIGNGQLPLNPNAGPGNNSGNDNPNAGPGNNSGNNNPNAEPGNNSGNNNPNAGPGNNSGNNNLNADPTDDGDNDEQDADLADDGDNDEQDANPLDDSDDGDLNADQDDNSGNNNPNVGPGNNSGNNNPNAGPGNNSGNNNPNAGPGNNSGNNNPNAGPGNNSGNNNPNAGPGNNSGNNNPNAGPGNNSGNNNPNAGPGNNSGNNNPNSGSGNNSGNDNPNSGSGNNSGNNNPNSGSGNNSGNKH